jgi:hypothetical protein
MIKVSVLAQRDLMFWLECGNCSIHLILGMRYRRDKSTPMPLQTTEGWVYFSIGTAPLSTLYNSSHRK